MAWLDLRSRGGEVVLRIEDLDGPRIKAGAAAAAVDDLSWLGLDWDEGPLFQRADVQPYQAALEKLQHLGLVYRCRCSRKDVEDAASAPHETIDGRVYPGTCRNCKVGADETHCWRFGFAAEWRCDFTDRFRGPQSFMAASELGDFVVWKRDGEPAYQLAVVVDDARQCINEVVRADDLLASTARQIALYRALELTPPGFAHLPLVVGEDGRRLAKRHGDTTLRFFRGQGMKPEQLVGLLAHWSGLNPQQHQISAAELLEDFSLERVSQQQPVWSGQVR